MARAFMIYKTGMDVSALEKNYLRSDIPEIRPGDTVRVYQKIKEGDKERVTPFEGMVLARKHGKGVIATFTVRKVVGGIGVERIFPLHSPTITKIDVLRHSKTRRAKLYYIREKAAREIRKKMKQVWRENIVPPEVKAEEAAKEEPAEAAT